MWRKESATSKYLIMGSVKVMVAARQQKWTTLNPQERLDLCGMYSETGISCFYSWKAEAQFIVVTYQRHSVALDITPHHVTHHASSGVQLSVGYAAEVAATASVVFCAVSDGPKGVQENLQRIEGRTDHQLFSVEGTSEKRKSVTNQGPACYWRNECWRFVYIWIRQSIYRSNVKLGNQQI